jgi:predicted secreted protein
MYGAGRDGWRSRGDSYCACLRSADTDLDRRKVEGEKELNELIKMTS